MIVMDLEWNRSYDKKRLDEILQIGAVRIDAAGGPIRDTFNRFIKPRVHKKFDPGARKLPDLRESVNSELTFREAWADFTAWCGADRTFAFWGPDDFHVIEQNCAFWDVPCLTERVYNFQRAFAHACGAGDAMMALWRVVDYLGIPDVFDYHNALYDSVYTACVGQWLRQEDLDHAPPKKPGHNKKDSLSDLAFEPGPERPVGPFADEAEALDDRDSRTPECPICARRAMVSSWCGEEDGPFYAPFSCREHGWFLCRLSMARDESGTVWGSLGVPALTEELLADYREVRAGGSIPCRRLRDGAEARKRRRGRKRVRRRRRAAEKKS